jgi:hypothetical protein
MTAKTRAMLRSLRPQEHCTPMTGHYHPAFIRSATLTYFIAVPLAKINISVYDLNFKRTINIYLTLSTTHENPYSIFYSYYLSAYI